MYSVTKTYPHSLGLSACFRQHAAESHCRFLHGYALQFTLEFQSETLNVNNWVIDFGSLKPIKQWLIESFDHRMIVAADDPQLEALQNLRDLGIVDNLLVLPHVGCEAYARYVFDYVKSWLGTQDVKIVKVTCAEHSGNSASYGE